MRAVLKRKITTIYVANKNISIPNVPFVSMQVVEQGPDEADHRIAQLCEAQDLVIVTCSVTLSERQGPPS